MLEHGLGNMVDGLWRMIFHFCFLDFEISEETQTLFHKKKSISTQTVLNWGNLSVTIKYVFNYEIGPEINPEIATTKKGLVETIKRETFLKICCQFKAQSNIVYFFFCERVVEIHIHFFIVF